MQMQMKALKKAMNEFNELVERGPAENFKSKIEEVKNELLQADEGYQGGGVTDTGELDKIFEATIRWAAELTGINSVIPWITDNINISTEESIKHYIA